MDAFNPIPSPAIMPGSVEAVPMDVSAPSTPLGGGPLSVSSMPGTPLLFTPTIGGGGGSQSGGSGFNVATASAQPPTPIMNVANSPVAVRTGVGNEGGEVKVEMPQGPPITIPPVVPAAAFQYQHSPSGPGSVGGGGRATGKRGGGSAAAAVGDGAEGGAHASFPFSGRERERNDSGGSNLAVESSGFALSDLLMQLEDYAPTIPDAVANHYLHQAGFESVDPRMSRVLSLAAQKFISDVVNEAFTHCKLKGQVNNQPKAKVKDKKYSLSMDDLVPVLNDHGITVKKPPYYT